MQDEIELREDQQQVIDRLVSITARSAGMSGLSSWGDGPCPFSVISPAISAMRASSGMNGSSRNIRPNRPSWRRDSGM